MGTRGGRTDTPLKLGSLYATLALGANAEGSAAGDPIEWGWVDIDQHNPVVGVSRRAYDGTWRNTDFSIGELREIELVLTVYTRTWLNSLLALLATSSPLACILPHRTGTFTGNLKPDRNKGPIRAESGDHNFSGGYGKDLHIYLLATSGAWS